MFRHCTAVPRRFSSSRTISVLPEDHYLPSQGNFRDVGLPPPLCSACQDKVDAAVESEESMHWFVSHLDSWFVTFSSRPEVLPATPYPPRVKWWTKYDEEMEKVEDEAKKTGAAELQRCGVSSGDGDSDGLDGLGKEKTLVGRRSERTRSRQYTFDLSSDLHLTFLFYPAPLTTFVNFAPSSTPAPWRLLPRIERPAPPPTPLLFPTRQRPRCYRRHSLFLRG